MVALHCVAENLAAGDHHTEMRISPQCDFWEGQNSNNNYLGIAKCTKK